MTSLREEESKSCHELIAAIDFGTDGTALAFALHNTKEVYIRQDWNEKDKHNNENFGVKMKTNILLNRIHKISQLNDENIFGNIEETKRSDSINDSFDYEFVAFGDEAKNKYKNKHLYKSKNWLYFEAFKMALFEGKCTKNEKVKINEYLESKNGIKVKSSVVFIESFKYIIRQTKLWVEKHSDVVKLSNGLHSIQWIISVPAIWSDASKHLMMEWFHSAGISRNSKIKLEYEPDCASISVLSELRESNVFSKNGRYILLDLGGGTADIACHEILDENEVCEIYHPSGGAWGSTYIDIEFAKLLNDMFGEKVIDTFKRKHEGLYMTLLDNFVNGCKLKFFHRNFKRGKVKRKYNNNSTHNTELPLEFIEYLEEEQNIDDLEEYLNDYEYKNETNLVSLHNEQLSLNYKIWFDLFNICVNPIISHLKQLLNKVSKIKHLILVGGFSISKYIEYRITQTFGTNSSYNLNIIVPKKPLLCVVNGAARLGLNPNYMSSRKLLKTYGIKCVWLCATARKLGIPDDYILQNTKLAYNREKLVTNCFKIFARKNETIRRGQKIIQKFYHYGSKKNEICVSDLVDPYTIKQGKIIGYIQAPNKIKRGEDYWLVFYFGGTVIKVYWKDMNNNQLSETTIKYQIT